MEIRCKKKTSIYLPTKNFTGTSEGRREPSQQLVLTNYNDVKECLQVHH